MLQVLPRVISTGYSSAVGIDGAMAGFLNEKARIILLELIELLVFMGTTIASDRDTKLEISSLGIYLSRNTTLGS